MTVVPGQRCWLDGGAWVVHRPGAVHDPDGLLEEVLRTTRFRQEEIVLFGRRLLQPRLTAWYGVAMDVATRYRTTLPAQPWPPALAAVRRRLSEECGVEFNSALVNLYRDGRDSVAWHADDEPALGPHPVIASVSLGATRAFHLRPRAGGPATRLALGHGDVVVMGGDLQRRWVHSVPKAASVTAPRVNLTFRRYELDGAGGR